MDQELASQQLRDFLEKMPPGQNPYLEVAAYLESNAKPRTLPTQAQNFLKFLMGVYFLMWLQSFYLLYVRIRTKMFRLLTVSRFGIWRFDVPNICAITYFVYPPLVLADLSLQYCIDAGERDMSNRIPLMVCKFSAIMTAGWAFLWVCTCQWVSLVFDAKWSKNSSCGHKKDNVLPRSLVITMNIAFVVIIIWVIPTEVFLMFRADFEYKKSKEVLKKVIISLSSEAANFEPETYEELRLLVMMLPVKQMLVHEENIGRAIRAGLVIGLVDCCVLTLLSVPLLRISLKLLRKRVAEGEIALNAIEGEQREHLARVHFRVRQELWTLITHGISINLATLTFIPVLAWQVVHADPGFLQSTTWMTVTQLGLHGPFGIIGNFIGLMLNLQARRLLLMYRSHGGLGTASSSSWAITECGSIQVDATMMRQPSMEIIISVKSKEQGNQNCEDVECLI